MSVNRSDFGYPENFFSVNELIKKLVGLWFPGSDYKLPFRIAYMMFVIIFHGCGLAMVVCEIIYFFDSFEHISVFVSVIEILLSLFASILKSSVILFGMKKLKEMMGTLQEEIYIAAGDFNPGEFMQKQKDTNSLVTILLVTLYCSSTSGTTIVSFIMMDKWLEQDSLIGTNLTCYDFMPCPFYIPFPTDTKLWCQVTAVFMGLGYSWASAISGSCDTLFIGLLSCLRTQLVIICNIFRTIRERALIELNLPENYDILYDSENPLLEKKLYSQLRRTTKHLMALLRVRDDMENIFTFATLGQCMASLFVIAACLFVTSSAPVGSPDFYIQILYSLSMSIQFALLCWYGNELKIASEEVATSLYESNWYSGTTQYKSSMIITMTRMQRPAFLTIGKFAPLTLTLMISVYKASFSYYTVFKEVQ